MSPRLRTALQSALILLGGAFVYAPVIHGTALWDDSTQIMQNAALRDPAGWWKIWLAPAGLDYFPLSTFTHWVQWRLWAGRAAGYHLTNLGLHLLSAFLFWRLLGKLGVKRAWWGGRLFAIHPLAVESVAWMSELKNVLSLPCLLLATAAYVDFDRDRRRRSLLRSFAWFLAALLAKTSVVMLPACFLLHAWWRRGRLSRRDVLPTLPFFGLSLALGMTTLWFQDHRAIAPLGISAEAFVTRLGAAGLAVVFYFSKCVWPANLLPIYPVWVVGREAWLAWGAVVGLLGWLVARRSAWSRHALLGLGWFLLHLAPVLGVVPMAYLRISRVADHLAYVPLLGVIGLVAAGWGHWAGVWSDPGRTRRLPLYAGRLAVIVACLLLAGEGRRCAERFRSEEALWEYTLPRNPGAWLAHNNLGQIRLQEGRVPEAVSECEEAVRLKPAFAPAHSNLGLALAQAGRVPEAIAQDEAALRLDPALAGTQLNLARALMADGRLPEALDCYEAGLRLDPDNAEAHSDFGLALARAERLTEAVEEYRTALRLNPDLPEAHNNLGNALARSGQLEEAILEFKTALRLRPDNAGTHRNLGFALRALGREPEAEEQFEAARRFEAAVESSE